MTFSLLEFALVALAVSLLLLLFFSFWRYLRYRETIALAERGLLPAEKEDEFDPLGTAVVFLAVGLALLVGTYPMGFTGSGSEFPFHLGPWLIPGLLFTFLGLGFLLRHVITSADEDAGDNGADSPPSAAA